MGLRFDHPWLLLLLLAPAWPLLHGLLRRVRRLPRPAATARRRRIPTAYLVLRGLVTALLILSLAGAHLQYPARHQAVVFVADISASTAAVRTEQEQFIRRALAAKAPADVAGVVAAGRDVQVEVPPSAGARFERFGAVVNPDHTDLERGLRLAAALLPRGYRRRIVLLSDGRENQGNVLAEAARLRQRGITVDVVPLRVPQGPEVLVRYMDAPGHLRQGEDLALGVTLHAGAPTTGVLRVYDNRTLVETRPVELPAGDRTVQITLERPAPGHHRIRVTVEAEPDTLPQNNEAGALVEVQGPPEVLVVEGAPGAGANVAAALSATGMQAAVQPAGALPAHAASFARYTAVVLADVPAVALGAETMAALGAYVREGGGGLVALGGQHSYGMGGYAGTPLEQLLPVRMEIPQRKEIPAVALALLIENLEGDWKTDIGKEAGKAVVGLLGPRDQVAVNDITAGWAVPLQYVTDKEAIHAAIDAMSPGDPPHYIGYLEAAHQVLKAADARVKHIIAVFDGDAQAASMSEYRRAVAAIAADGITLSTIHVNPTRPEEYVLLQSMAQWGGGRYHLGTDFNQVPEILLKEAQATARSAVVEMDFAPVAVGAHPLLRGLAEFPVLHGYVGTTAKPAAQVVLQSPHNDPVLAAWQIGLGRAVAWTSDTQGQWTADFLAWPGAARFLSNLVGWTLPAAGTGDLELRTRIQGAVARVEAQLGPGALAALNRGGAATEWPAALAAIALRPDGTPSVNTLNATGPGRYEGDVPVPQIGPYVLMLSAVSGGESVRVGTTGLLVPYSPEFAAAGVDEPLLRQVARAAGGKVTDTAAPAAAFAPDLPPAPGTLPLSPALLVAALLLWPVDIAARRLALTRGDWQAAVAALRRRRPGGASQAAAAAGMKEWAARLRSSRRPLPPSPTPPSPRGSAPADRPAAPPVPDRPRPAPRPGAAEPKPAPGSSDPAPEELFTRRLLNARRQRKDK